MTQRLGQRGLIGRPAIAGADRSGACMPAEATLPQRARVRARVALSRTLELVPLSLVEAARDHKVLVPLLRHRSLRAFGTVTIKGDPPAWTLTLLAKRPTDHT